MTLSEGRPSHRTVRRRVITLSCPAGKRRRIAGRRQCSRTPPPHRSTLGLEPFIHPTAQVRDSRFGAYCEVGARSKVAESTFGDYSYVVNDADIIYSEIGRFYFDRRADADQPGQPPAASRRAEPLHLPVLGDGLGADDAGFFDWRRSHRVISATTCGSATARSSCRVCRSAPARRSVRARGRHEGRAALKDRGRSAGACASPPLRPRRSSQRCSASPGGTGTAPGWPMACRTSAGLMPRRSAGNTTPPSAGRPVAGRYLVEGRDVG